MSKKGNVPQIDLATNLTLTTPPLTDGAPKTPRRSKDAPEAITRLNELGEFLKSDQSLQWKIGDAVWFLTESCGYTIKELAQKFNYSPNRLSDIKNTCKVFANEKDRRYDLPFFDHELVRTAVTKFPDMAFEPKILVETIQQFPQMEIEGSNDKKGKPKKGLRKDMRGVARYVCSLRQQKEDHASVAQAPLRLAKGGDFIDVCHHLPFQDLVPNLIEKGIKFDLIFADPPYAQYTKVASGEYVHVGVGRGECDCSTQAEATRAYREAERKYLEFMQLRERHQHVEVAVADATVRDVAEKFLQGIEARYQRGEVSASHFSKVTSFVQNFAAYVGTERLFRTVMELELNDFRNHILSLPLSDPKSFSKGKPIRPATARDILWTVKSLYQWAYELRLCELPRNLKSFSKCPLPQPQIKTYSIEEVRRLWDAADQRLRCFMALALNCGYGQTDISDLKVSDVEWEKGIIDRLRSKTGVRQRHKLWPITLELLQKERNPKAQGEDRVFTTSLGLPLVHDVIIDGKRKKSDSIKCCFWRVQNKTKINGGRGFYCLRKTAATEIEKIDPLVTEMFLGHTEKGMKKHYAERHFELLDEALEKLEGVMELTNEIATASA